MQLGARTALVSHSIQSALPLFAALALTSLHSGCAAAPTPAALVFDGGVGGRDAAPAFVDLGGGSADLASSDLASAVDLASGADLATAVDLGRVADLATAIDLAVDPCVVLTSAPTVVATAASADDFAFTLDAQSLSQTSWATAGNEAVVLDVLRGQTFVGHLVLHQGQTLFHYGMQLGALAAGDSIALRVSARSAALATQEARVCAATLTAATALGAAGEGLKHAPVFIWPAAKTFDDLPVVLGWSQTKQQYVIVYTNENGGTTVSCGGGASGMRAEVARWGRGCDIEDVYSYGAAPAWLRCTGETTPSANAPRMEAAHPILYYGDGHNRLFESRAGYGAACGTGAPERADGDLVGWNVQNPGNDAAHDADVSITVRPLPVDLDSIGFVISDGRREGLVDTYAPWLYRITDEELEREGKIDGSKMLPLDRYLYVDVQAADVDGSGDRVCAAAVSKGFVLRVETAGGLTLDGPQMTASYMGGSPAWKRLAIPLDRTYAPSELTGLIFDAYDKDGIYFLTIGDAFMVRASGDNGATLLAVRAGDQSIGVYVDDDSSGCANGSNSDGPGGGAYPCVGGAYSFTP
jgi:hypothetical protein